MSAPETAPGSEELVVTQHVAAPVQEVWRAWTTADGWARWWWPHWADTEYAVDARPGGSYRASSAEGGVGVAGQFVTVDPPHLLELTWRWDGEPDQDAVRVEFAEQDGGTRVTVRHRTGPAGLDDYRQGWEFVLDHLGSALAASDRLLRRVHALPGPKLVVEQLVHAPPPDVYAAWLDPARLATWWWPDLGDTTYEIDAREGGRFRIWSEAAGSHGTYLHLGGPETPRILMTFFFDRAQPGGADAPEDLVHVGFTDLGRSTLVELTHAMAIQTDDTESPRAGWAQVLAELDRRLR